MYTKLISIGELAKRLGVCVMTIRRWECNGTIKPAIRTPGKHRRFDYNDFVSTDNKLKTVIYARVSSRDQVNDLTTQLQVLLQYCEQHNLVEPLIIKDIGSGLNYKKSGFNKLMDLILNQQVNKIILNHKDRLLRFGSEIVFKLCKRFGVQIVILNETTLDFRNRLCDNVIELMTVFCSSLYGSRAHKNSKKIKSDNERMLVPLT